MSPLDEFNFPPVPDALARQARLRAATEPSRGVPPTYPILDGLQAFLSGLFAKPKPPELRFAGVRG